LVSGCNKEFHSRLGEIEEEKGTLLREDSFWEFVLLTLQISGDLLGLVFEEREAENANANENAKVYTVD